MVDLKKSLEVLGEVVKAGGGEVAKSELAEVEPREVGAGLLALAKRLQEDDGFLAEVRKADGEVKVEKAGAVELLQHIGAMFGGNPEDMEEYNFSWKVQEGVRAIQQAAIVERAMAAMAGAVSMAKADDVVDEGEGSEGDVSPRGETQETGWEDEDEGWEED